MESDVQLPPNQLEPGRLNTQLTGLVSKITVHGPSNMIEAHHWNDKLLWSLVLICALGGLIVHTANQVQMFLSNPVSSTVSQQPNSFTMPDVTVCDPLLNKFFKYSFDGYDKEMKLNRSLVNHTMQLQMVYGQLFGWESLKFLEALYTSLEHKINMSEVGARLSDFVVACWYRGASCSESDFVTFFHRRFGNCFTFRPGVRRLDSGSSDEGLILVLYSPSTDASFPLDRIMKTISGLESQGFRIVIHQSDTPPDPDSSALFVPTGTRLDLPLTKSATALVSTRTKPCVQPAYQTYYDSMLRRNFSYLTDINDCIAAERDRDVYQLCGCKLEGLVPIASPNAPLVTLSNHTDGRLHFCHDLFGFVNVTGQQQAQVIRSLTPISDSFKKNLATLNKRHKGLPPDVMQEVLRKFWYLLVKSQPLLMERSNRLLCALKLKRNMSHERPTRCTNVCLDEQYQYSVGQSTWPVEDAEVRGSSIQLGKLSRLLFDYSKSVAALKPQPALLRSLNPGNFSLCASLDSDTVAIFGQQRDQMEALKLMCHPLQRFLRRHLSQVRIFAKSLNVQVLQEERSYTAISLMSDLGGISGLWIGASFVSIFEVGEILWLVASFAMLRIRAALTGVKLTNKAYREPSEESSPMTPSPLWPQTILPQSPPFSLEMQNGPEQTDFVVSTV